ncbi:MAG: PaaI family thioesterase [Bacteriovoracaceae bacterium]|nr:PaaI family thioesterase [Bacteriovoracaceae bacterium]
MLKSVTTTIENIIPQSVRDTALVRLFGFTKIPLLWYIKPIVTYMDEKECTIKIPLNRRTKNHLNSMYFGVLSAGADCAGGFFAMKQIMKSGKNVSLSFKEFHAEFLKRAEGDTYFKCTQGEEITAFVDKVLESGERENMPLHIIATCPDKLGDEPVAKFTLTLSLKKKEKK